MRFNNTKIICSALFLVSILLSACSGGGSSGASSTPAATPQTTSTLSGVAAVGSPIVNGTINISCAAGSALAPTTTSSMGAWQVMLSGQTLPCAVQVSGGTINGVANTTLYHSIAIVPGTVNVTPFTDLMVANLAGTATPSIWFTGLSTTPTPLTAITQTQVDAALAKLRIALSGLTQLSTINPITTAFTPTSGNISDDMLTALKTVQTNTGVTYMSLLGNASIPAFTAPVTGFNTALITSYAGIANGTTTGGTASTAGPGITGVLPTSAAPGTAVTISGTNFAAGTNLSSGSNYRVSFNGTTVTPSARTLTQLAVIVPTGATSGTLMVTDLTTNVVYTVPGGFTVTGNTSSNSYTIGGSVSGLSGSLVLQDNGGNNKTVSSNGAFTFPTQVASGSTYNVTVLTQPTGQTCAVTGGSGTATNSVTGVVVNCTNTTSPSLPAGYVSQGGLIWMPEPSTVYTYTQAAALCAGTINGQTGWRLPTRPELNALYWFQYYSVPLTNQGWMSGITWTSTPNGVGYHQFVDLFFSLTSNSMLYADTSNSSGPDTNSLGVTCVKTASQYVNVGGGSNPVCNASQALTNGVCFTSTNNVSQSDYISEGGLTWTPASAALLPYVQAVAFCADPLNGLAGWRLPTQSELSALYSAHLSSALAGHKWTLGVTWSSTSGGVGLHSGVSLGSGYVYSTFDSDTFSVTCVR